MRWAATRRIAVTFTDLSISSGCVGPRCSIAAVMLAGASLGAAGCSGASRLAPPAPSGAAVASAATALTTAPPDHASSPTAPPATAAPASPTTASAPPAPATAVLPDPAFTPGATNPEVTQATIGATICTAGWTATVRPPESYTERIKHLEDQSGGAVTYDGVTYRVHGFELPDPDVGHFELDHLIPLEVGGSPTDPDNLWMEPYELPEGDARVGTGSQTKDKVENVASAAVCAGRLTLADAQQQMAANWYVLGKRLDAFG